MTHKWILIALMIVAFTFVADYITSPMPPLAARSTT